MKAHDWKVVTRARELHKLGKRGSGYWAISKILWREFRVMVSVWTVRDWIARDCRLDTQGPIQHTTEASA